MKMRVAVQAEDVKALQVLFGLLLAGDSPFDITELQTDTDETATHGEPFSASMVLTIDDGDDEFFARQAGLMYIAQKRIALNEIGQEGQR